jgi:hypothetical protein
LNFKRKIVVTVTCTNRSNAFFTAFHRIANDAQATSEGNDQFNADNRRLLTLKTAPAIARATTMLATIA